eukprot:TRINITY_DN109757_c0_g1_i1.p1 TRINITY_DN109757_c0_g1~~TRINITY_DN109757_c0_g1_i1.p1  ORF type:complete len:149 (+),score=6.30 TRINITY_DN109757_c0_g1_i1:113-559(+)
MKPGRTSFSRMICSKSKEACMFMPKPLTEGLLDQSRTRPGFGRIVSQRSQLDLEFSCLLFRPGSKLVHTHTLLSLTVGRKVLLKPFLDANREVPSAFTEERIKSSCRETLKTNVIAKHIEQGRTELHAVQACILPPWQRGFASRAFVT